MDSFVFELLVALAVAAAGIGGLFAWYGLVVLALKLSDRFSVSRPVSIGCSACDYTGVVQDPNFGSLSGCGGGVACPECGGRERTD